MARTEKVFRATVLVTLVIILSKAVGFARDMITASYFGAGLENDAYVASYSLFYLPILLFNSCISSTMVPLYIQERNSRGARSAGKFAGNAMNVFVLAALLVSVAMYALATPLAHVVFPGYGAEKIALTAHLTRIMMVSLVFNVISIVMSTLLNARERYVAAQLTGFPLSLTVIVASVFFSGKYGIDAIAWGVFAAGILQVLVQVPFLAGWFPLTGRVDFNDPRLRQMLALALPAMMSMAVSEIGHMIDSFFASFQPEGAVTALNYSFRLITFISGILVVPITTIMFSKVSKLVTANDRGGVIALVRNCVESISLIVVPIIAISAVVSEDVVRFAYGRGAFDDAAVRMTAGAFLSFVLGVLFFGVRDLLNRAFNSLRDTKTPFYVTIVTLGTNTLLDLVLGHFFGVNGLAFATTGAGLVSVVVMFALFRRRMGFLGLKKSAREIAKIALAGAVCALVCAGMNAWLPPMLGTLRLFLRLAAVTITSGLAYILTLLALRERQLISFVEGAPNEG